MRRQPAVPPTYWAVRYTLRDGSVSISVCEDGARAVAHAAFLRDALDYPDAEVVTRLGFGTKWEPVAAAREEV